MNTRISINPKLLLQAGLLLCLLFIQCLPLLPLDNQRAIIKLCTLQGIQERVIDHIGGTSGDSQKNIVKPLCPFCILRAVMVLPVMTGVILPLLFVTLFVYFGRSCLVSEYRAARYFAARAPPLCL